MKAVRWSAPVAQQRPGDDVELVLGEVALGLEEGRGAGQLADREAGHRLRLARGADRLVALGRVEVGAVVGVDDQGRGHRADGDQRRRRRSRSRNEGAWAYCRPEAGHERRQASCARRRAQLGDRGQRLPQVEARRGCGAGARARRSPGPRSASASPRGRTRSGSLCGCRGRRRRGRRGARGGRAGTSPRSSWPSPRTATISAIASSSPSSSSRSSSSSPLEHVGGEVADVLDLAPGEPGAAQVRLARLQQLLGRGGGAAEEVEHPQVDRPRRFGRELLADDRAQQRPVGVGGALLAAPLQPRRQVDLADPLDQRRHHRVGLAASAAAGPGAHRPCPLGLALLAEGADALAEVLRGEAGLAQLDQVGLLLVAELGTGVEQARSPACCRASRAARWRRSRRPARPRPPRAASRRRLR